MAGMLIQRRARPKAIVTASAVAGALIGAAVFLWTDLRDPLAKTNPGMNEQFVMYLGFCAASWAVVGAAAGLTLGWFASWFAPGG